MLGAVDEIASALGSVEIDAKVSRQVKALVQLTRQRREAGQLGAVVIVHIGTNGPVSAQQFDALMAELRDVPRVVVVNARVPRRWETPNNRVLAEGAVRYPNVVLVDWNAASAQRADLLWRDGVHLRPGGAREFAALIAAAVYAQQASPAAHAQGSSPHD